VPVLSLPLLPALGAAALVCAVTPPPASRADTLRALYERGVSFEQFLAAAAARKATWRDNYARGELPADVAARLARVTGPWRLLVVAEDWCGDSANTIPFVATLADSSAGRLELRIVDSRVGKAIMEAHRTADGRVATPTIILLDAAYREVGCWVERPAEATRLVARVRASDGGDAALGRKYAWYREDGGQSTLREILSMIEAAAPGAPCGGNTAAGGA
jgi:hypothetical protein